MDMQAAGRIAIYDQTVANLREVAKLVAAYHQALIEAGMLPEEAEAIVLDWHEAYWRYQFYGSGR
jgi:hypothetical protein